VTHTRRAIDVPITRYFATMARPMAMISAKMPSLRSVRWHGQA
jgi:hypothetical protein